MGKRHSHPCVRIKAKCIFLSPCTWAFSYFHACVHFSVPMHLCIFLFPCTCAFSCPHTPVHFSIPMHVCLFLSLCTCAFPVPRHLLFEHTFLIKSEVLACWDASVELVVSFSVAPNLFLIQAYTTTSSLEGISRILFLDLLGSEPCLY